MDALLCPTSWAALASARTGVARTGVARRANALSLHRPTRPQFARPLLERAPLLPPHPAAHPCGGGRSAARGMRKLGRETSGEDRAPSRAMMVAADPRPGPGSGPPSPVRPPVRVAPVRRLGGPAKLEPSLPAGSRERLKPGLAGSRGVADQRPATRDRPWSKSAPRAPRPRATPPRFTLGRAVTVARPARIGHHCARLSG